MLRDTIAAWLDEHTTVGSTNLDRADIVIASLAAERDEVVRVLGGDSVTDPDLIRVFVAAQYRVVVFGAGHAHVRW